MRIEFFDDPLRGPKSRDEVRLNQLGIFVYPDKRRIAVGFDLTPFLEKPSIEVVVVNANGEKAGTLHIIEAFQPNFSLTLHLRDANPTDIYYAKAMVYYAAPGEEWHIVHQLETSFDVNEAGDQGKLQDVS